MSRHPKQNKMLADLLHITIGIKSGTKLLWVTIIRCYGNKVCICVLNKAEIY